METLVAVLLVVVSLVFLWIAIDATRYPKVRGDAFYAAAESLNSSFCPKTSAMRCNILSE